jgi:hypothetical protein
MAARSRRSSSARRAVSSRAFDMNRVSRAISRPRQARAFGRGRENGRRVATRGLTTVVIEGRPPGAAGAVFLGAGSARADDAGNSVKRDARGSGVPRQAESMFTNRHRRSAAASCPRPPPHPLTPALSPGSRRGRGRIAWRPRRCRIPRFRAAATPAKHPARPTRPPGQCARPGPSKRPATPRVRRRTATPQAPAHAAAASRSRRYASRRGNGPAAIFVVADPAPPSVAPAHAASPPPRPRGLASPAPHAASPLLRPA